MVRRWGQEIDQIAENLREQINMFEEKTSIKFLTDTHIHSFSQIFSQRSQDAG
jgi:hypothetical protein